MCGPLTVTSAASKAGLVSPSGLVNGSVRKSNFAPSRLIRISSTRGKTRSEEHTSELQSHLNLVCRLLLEKKKINEPVGTRVRADVHTHIWGVSIHAVLAHTWTLAGHNHPLSPLVLKSTVVIRLVICPL